MKILSKYLGKPKGLLTVFVLSSILCVAIMSYRKGTVMRQQTQGNQRQAVLLSYMAGIIDGEGCIRLGKCSGKKTMESTRSITPKYVAYIQLGMVEKVIPDLFCSTFGGSVREERVPGHRSMWRWAITSRPQVTKVLKTIMPYLIIKKKHAETIIKFCDGFVKTSRYTEPTLLAQETQRREDAYRTMRKFNAVGAAAETNRENTREGEVIVRPCRKLQEVT